MIYRIKIFVLLLILTFSTIAAQQLKLELSVDKSEYLVGEPILVKLLVINQSNNDFIIDNFNENQERNGLGFFPIALGETDFSFYDRMRIYPNPNIKAKVAAGDTAYYYIDFTRCYVPSVVHRSDLNKWNGPYIMDGDYNMKFELTNDLKERKKYYSNTVKFKIVEPSDEEFQVFQKINSDLTFNEKLQLIKDYPESNYKLNMFINIRYNITRENLFEYAKYFCLADTSGRTLEYLMLFPKFGVFRDKIGPMLLNDPQLKEQVIKRNLKESFRQQQEYREKRKAYGEILLKQRRAEKNKN